MPEAGAEINESLAQGKDFVEADEREELGTPMLETNHISEPIGQPFGILVFDELGYKKIEIWMLIKGVKVFLYELLYEVGGPAATKQSRLGEWLTVWDPITLDGVSVDRSITPPPIPTRNPARNRVPQSFSDSTINYDISGTTLCSQDNDDYRGTYPEKKPQFWQHTTDSLYGEIAGMMNQDQRALEGELEGEKW